MPFELAKPAEPAQAERKLYPRRRLDTIEPENVGSASPGLTETGFPVSEDIPAPAAPGGPSAAVYGPRGRTRVQIGKQSSRKGADGEREVLTAFRSVMMNVEEQLKDEGLTFVARSDFATRKRIEKGTSNRDLGNIPLISIEVKRNENLNVAKAWEQAVRQADKLLPVLVYRYNREPWRVRTTAALINPNGSAALYVVGEVSLPDFLTYFSTLYSGYLKGVVRE